MVQKEKGGKRMGKKMNTEKVIWTKCSVLFKICKWSRSDGVYKHSNSTADQNTDDLLQIRR